VILILRYSQTKLTAEEFAEIEAEIDNRLAGISGVSVDDIGAMVTARNKVVC
jgi:hypothetical protein